MNRWWHVALWATLIIVLSVGPTGPEVSAFWPYAVHFIEYAILGILLYRAIVYTWKVAGGLSAIAAIAAASAYGAAMELVQLSLSYRGFGYDDIVTNFAGAALGLLVWQLVFKRDHKHGELLG
jgi:VanZ family protein